ncbi:hypothetical protein SLEP1_g51089 [Rubroshorea leprosula]|uniref:HMA domain-containing protein n=2 Tax=Rubroshorea leprosula TaxID=152421 RepID=A0AAV5M264_9ROSI|nr:hypothetical protein SLEP1_g51089 [Rubroshorea leprosula]
MVQQKIVIKVSMNCEKCRTKALKIAAAAEGVTSVALQGPDKDKLVIEGDGVDAACLTKSLRKKLCHAILETVEKIKPKEDKKKEPECKFICCHQPQVDMFKVVPVYEPCQSGGCTIV